ncbi:hypothetical protein BJ165DRAFT_1125277 [Panaeolus papilionaceus]|nr:hypothetical protein BJ165DRAFT_1125277 [Panaeolus papilionaceus]
MHHVLPPELILQIFRNLQDDRVALYRLMYLHRSFRTDLERLLYRSMTDMLYSDAIAHWGFLRSITRNPILASYVHTYGIIEMEHDEDCCCEECREQEPWDEEYEIPWREVLDGIRAMSNLKVFVLDTLEMSFPEGEVLSALQHKQLHGFTWQTVAVTGNEVFELLANQPDLQELRIFLWTRSSEDIFDQKWIPNLTHLVGNPHAFSKILPGRRIFDLIWTRGELIPEILDPALFPVLSSLRSLTALNMDQQKDITFLSHSCPGLQSLHVSQNDLLDNLQEWLNALAQLKSLRELIVDLVQTKSGPLNAQWISFIFGILPSLDTLLLGPVEILYDYSSVRTRCTYEHWVATRSNRDTAQSNALRVTLDRHVFLDNSWRWRGLREQNMYPASTINCFDEVELEY